MMMMMIITIIIAHLHQGSRLRRHVFTPSTCHMSSRRINAQTYVK